MSEASKAVIHHTFFMYGKSQTGEVAMDTIVTEDEYQAARIFLGNNPDMFWAGNYKNMVDNFMP